MNGGCAHTEQDWELFALGSLDEAAERGMASHLRSGCRECRQRFQEAQAAVLAVAATAPLVQPSASVERALLRRIRGESPQRASWSWPRWNVAPWAVAAACLALAGGLFWQQRQLGTELATAHAELQSLRQRMAPGQESPSSAQGPASATSSALASGNERPDRSQSARGGAGDTRLAVPNPADKKKIAELEDEVAELSRQNANVTAAAANAQERAAQLQAELTGVRAKADEVAHDLDATKATASTTSPAEMAALGRQLAETRAEVQRLKQTALRDSQIESLLQSGSLHQVELRSVEPAVGHAVARALYSPRGGLLLIADSLPQLEHEKCYQLWLIRKGAPAIVSGGLLQTSSDGRGFLFAPPSNDLAEVTGFAITDEPKGGSVSARGHKLLFGAR